ncbi:MAG TPA: hypothetical protein VGP70_01085 [Actinomadura sp.]|nr:hypothetical protein [Actinomadura sp.]
MRQGARQAFHQYFPSFGLSSTSPGAGLAVVSVSTTKSAGRPVFGAYFDCCEVMRFWCAALIVSQAGSACRCSVCGPRTVTSPAPAAGPALFYYIHGLAVRKVA